MFIAVREAKCSRLRRRRAGHDVFSQRQTTSSSSRCSWLPHAAQCVGILQRTARPLAGASYSWVNDMGFGRLHPEAAIEEALAINRRVKV